MLQVRTAPAHRPATSAQVWLAAWPVTAVFVLSNAATPLYVLWQHRIGFSRGTLTVVFACYILGLLGSLLVSGVASDRLGRKPVLLPALAAALVACGLFATASSVAALMAARLLTGIAVGAAVSAGMAAVTDVAGPERRRLAALLASTAMVFGAGLGPLLAGVLSETGPAWTVFALEAVLLTTAIAAVLRMPLPNTRKSPNTPESEARDVRTTEPGPVRAAVAKHVRAAETHGVHKPAPAPVHEPGSGPVREAEVAQVGEAEAVRVRIAESQRVRAAEAGRVHATEKRDVREAEVARVREAGPVREAETARVADAEPGCVREAEAARVREVEAGPVRESEVGAGREAEAGCVHVAESGRVHEAGVARGREAGVGRIGRTGGWLRVPGVPRGNRGHLAMGVAVFAPGITATSFVLSLGPSLLSGLLGTDNRIVAGATAFVMFIAATGVQFAVQGLARRKVLLAGAASTLASMGTLVLAVHSASVVPLVAAAVLAGAGQGLGQLGGLSLLNSNVPPRRLAEANAALNVGGYLLAGTLPVAAGYLSDPLGLTTGSTVFAAVLAVLAALGASVVLASSRR
ncbi:MFS transporter [Actinomadura rupiterrae]|uniref:MFS transporter n=1 Tax=Actinomadura rupiterrae TaxID=559627 RepID=UPI0020A362DC|nr:MFS transporter [Actinomadura rupiterrae]MCP2335420.1 MFS family permease [Actinomadura rupiterrae]